MQKYQIRRISNTANGAHGVFLIDGVPVCVTLEEEVKNNGKDQAIPAGVYKVGPHNGAKYKGVWILKDVPKRSAILIHQGNTDDNTAGCILVGKGFGKFKGSLDGKLKTGITNSLETLDFLRKTLPKEFTLEIIDCF